MLDLFVAIPAERRAHLCVVLQGLDGFKHNRRLFANRLRGGSGLSVWHDLYEGDLFLNDQVVILDEVAPTSIHRLGDSASSSTHFGVSFTTLNDRASVQ